MSAGARVSSSALSRTHFLRFLLVIAFFNLRIERGPIKNDRFCLPPNCSILEFFRKISDEEGNLHKIVSLPAFVAIVFFLPCSLAVDSWRNGALVSAAYLIQTANSRYYNHLHSTWPAKNCAKRRYLSHMFGFGLEKCGLQEELLQLVKLRLHLLVSLVCLSVCLSGFFAPTQQFCTHLTLNPKP